MAKKISAAVAAAASAYVEKPASRDQLKAITDKCAEARSLQKEIEDLQATLANKNAELYRLQHETIPTLMTDANVDTIGLPAAGNLPAYDVELKPFYNANIAASWDEERRAAGFDYLTKVKAGDLIKTTVKIPFNREDRKKAQDLIKELRKRKINAEVSLAVHANTLTSWLKEQVERHNTVPDLAKIGGTVGKIARMKVRKE